MPLLLNDLKQFNDIQQKEYIIEILKIFEILLSIVDSTLRMFIFFFKRYIEFYDLYVI